MSKQSFFILTFNLLFISTLFWTKHSFARPAKQGLSKAQNTQIQNHAPHDTNSQMALARQHFEKQEYAKSIGVLKRIQNKQPRYCPALELMAAAYFHIGLPIRALYFLKRCEKTSLTPSYNAYYQGMSFYFLEKLPTAKALLSRASQYSDLYASNALFELAIIEYHQKEFNQAANGFRMYLAKYPNGPYAQKAMTGLKSIQRRVYLRHLFGIAYPNADIATFKYNPLSLFDFQHFWLLGIATGYTESHEKDPVSSNGGGVLLKNTAALDYFLETQASFGIGPFTSTSNVVFAGYNYRQRWLTTPDRVQLYFEDITDFEYFLYRPDLLVRTHEFYLDYSRELFTDLFVGAYTKIGYTRMGSSFLTTPEDTEIQKSITIGQSQLLMPWVRSPINDYIDVMIYAYLNKNLNEEAPEFSHKTFEFGGNSPSISFGGRGIFNYPAISLKLNLEIFRFNYTYNDYWLDSRKEGVLVEAENEFLPSWHLKGSLGMYGDTYSVQQLKAGPCQSQETRRSNSDRPTPCWRTDQGFFYSAELYWNYTNFTRYAISYEFLENKNPNLTQFDQNIQTLTFSANIAFPDVNKVRTYTDQLRVHPLFNKKEGFE
ncbi:MAG: hypothetical protein KBD78_03365 [Oligoflexales bacterium]|nr:hypothetical protein [Oligoflexales bacterium]